MNTETSDRPIPTTMYQEVVAFIRELFQSPEDKIPLHAPTFVGNEEAYVRQTIESTFVSSVGSFVQRFEQDIAEYTGAKHAVAVVNGTSALHMALMLAGTKRETEVIVQPLSFVATCNAISYIGASPVFVDVERETLGLDPDALQTFLEAQAEKREDGTYNRSTGKRISACVPMHTFGLPARIDRIKDICDAWNIPLVEDAAESLGSTLNGKHTGTFGLMGIYSFNGNKTITCGGGGCIVTDDEALAKRAKHLTTTAKRSHNWEFDHDDVGYNYRMPNLNAALACAQLEQLEKFIENKRETAQQYAEFFQNTELDLVSEPENCRANNWLSAVLLPSKEARDAFLQATNDAGVMTRPAWKLMTDLPMFAQYKTSDLPVAEDLYNRLVNIPSSVRTHTL